MSGQRPPEQPEADGGDPGQQHRRAEHRAFSLPGHAAERLVRAAAHRREAGPGALCSPALRSSVSGNEVNISPGRRFMIDLLVGSLMAAGGLESALHAAITAEIQDIEAKKQAQKEKEIDEQEANASAFHRSRTPLDKDLINTGICESSGKQCLPLVQLIQQRLSQCERMVSIVLEGPTRRRWEEVRLSL
ncbi:E3 ubiquitin-protein ligase HERC2-like [Pongo abelii]|uniref:E3 ubiquitin-protein ligase HERC2-like n=2 Tax=Pongo abelii TaxID=9601 RepID=UPI0030051D12